MAVVDKNRTINGVDCEIHADLTGRWTVIEKTDEEDAPVRNRQLASADSIDKAVAAARIEINKRKVKVEVPFFTVNGEAGIAHGKNSRDRRILTNIGQLEPHVTVLDPDTPLKTVKRLNAIKAERNALIREEKEIMTQYGMRLDHAVDRAVEEKQPGFNPGPKRRR